MTVVASAPTGNVDKDFARAMTARMHAMMSLAKLEMECGKDAKAKAATQSLLDDESERMKTMDLILHTNCSAATVSFRRRLRPELARNVRVR